MFIDNIKYLPYSIESTENLEAQFKKLFGNELAKNIKGVVYFFLSEKPIPRFKGHTGTSINK